MTITIEVPLKDAREALERINDRAEANSVEDYDKAFDATLDALAFAEEVALEALLSETRYFRVWGRRGSDVPFQYDHQALSGVEGDLNAFAEYLYGDNKNSKEYLELLGKVSAFIFQTAMAESIKGNKPFSISLDDDGAYMAVEEISKEDYLSDDDYQRMLDEEKIVMMG